MRRSADSSSIENSGRNSPVPRFSLRGAIAAQTENEDPQPHVVCGLTGHQRTLRESLRAVLLSDGPTRVTEAITLARRLIGDHPRGRVIVLSDGCFDKAEAVSQAQDVQLHRVGQRTGNVGITQFQVRRSLFDPVGYEILIEVLNASDEPTECRLEIDLDQFPVDVVPLQLAAGER